MTFYGTIFVQSFVKIGPVFKKLILEGAMVRAAGGVI
jgi:hypothetical protein